jgi:glycosyltransferase involved in cell wall biosynthesis
MYDRLEENCDMWTQLAAKLIGDDYGEVWYWGGNRAVQYNQHITDRWIESFSDTSFDFKPDVIIARGGFPEYDCVVRRNPQAFKMYYGAGRRFLPADPGFYDVLLVDSPIQESAAQEQCPLLRCAKFVKPAAENIFFPTGVEKTINILFSGSDIPRKQLVPFLKQIRKLKVTVAGLVSNDTRRRFPNVSFLGWLPRKQMRDVYSAAKILVCCSDELDSNPRVISESMACGCPVIVTDSVMLWREKYLSQRSGVSVGWRDLPDTISRCVSNYQQFDAFAHYKAHLSMDCAAEHIMGLLNV